MIAAQFTGDPLFDGPMSWSVFAVVLIKVVFAFALLLVSVMLYIWGMRKVIAGLTSPEEVIRATVGDAD